MCRLPNDCVWSVTAGGPSNRVVRVGMGLPWRGAWLWCVRVSIFITAAGRQQQLERVGQPLELESIEPSSRSTFDVEPITKLELCGGGSKVEAQGGSKVEAQSLGLLLRLDLRGGGGDETWWGWAGGLRQQFGGPRAPALPEASATSVGGSAAMGQPLGGSRVLAHSAAATAAGEVRLQKKMDSLVRAVRVYSVHRSVRCKV